MKTKIEILFLHLFWIVLIYFSLLYAQERTFGDATHYLFLIVNTTSFDIQHARFVLALSQIGALIATYLGLSLHKIIVINSLWNCLFFYGILIWLIYSVKNIKAAYLLSFLLTAHYLAYFAPFLEVFYGCAFLILFVAAYHQPIHFKKYALIYYVVLWLAIFSHPLVLAAFAFYLLIIYLNDRQFTASFRNLLLLFALAVFIKICITNSYEASRYTTHKSYELSEYLNLFKNFIHLFIAKYKILLLFLVTAVGIQLFRRNYLNAFLSFFAYIGLILLVVYNTHYANYRWYNDVLNVSALLVLILPLIFSFSNQTDSRAKDFLIPIVSILLVINLFSIQSTSSFLKMRYAQMQTIGSEAKDLYPNHSKFRIDDKNLEKDFTVADMHFAYFSLLTSSEYGNANTIILAENEMMRFDSSKGALNKDNVLIWKHYTEDISTFNKDYFNIQSGDYIHLNAVEYDGNLQRIIRNTSLEINEAIENASSAEIIYPLLKLSIDSGIVFPSNQKYQFFISYHIYDNEGNMLEWDGLRNLIEMDFKYNFEQRIAIQAPKEKGNYIIEIDIVKEGEQWFELHQKMKLSVN